MKKLKELLEKNWFAYTFAACVGVVLYVLLTHMTGIGNFFSAFRDVISPVICGAVMAYLMNPLCNYFERKLFHKVKKDKLRHSLAVITTVVLVLIAIVLLFIALVPSLVQSVSVLFSNVPTYLENLENNLDKMSLTLEKFGIDTNQIESTIDKSLSDLFKVIPENIGTILSTSVSVGSSLFNLVIGFILAIYFLSG